MSPRHKRVPEEKVREWRRLHRDGWDYTAIARENGVDRRLVAKRIREYEQREMMRLDDSARRELAVKKLEEHFQDLELAARYLWRLSVSPTRTGSLRPYQDDGSLRLPHLLPALKLELRQLFLIRWGYGFHLLPDGKSPVWRPQDPAPEPDESMARREAENLIAGLNEHFPKISSLIDEWIQAAQHYRETWLKLENLVVGQGFSSVEVPKAIEKLLLLVNEEKLADDLNEWQTKSDSEDGGLDESFWFMYRSGEVRHRIAELAEYLRRLESVSTKLEEILSPGQIRNELLKTRCKYCSLR